jgi:hypothetical protein
MVGQRTLNVDDSGIRSRLDGTDNKRMDSGERARTYFF